MQKMLDHEMLMRGAAQSHFPRINTAVPGWHIQYERETRKEEARRPLPASALQQEWPFPKGLVAHTQFTQGRWASARASLTQRQVLAKIGIQPHTTPTAQKETAGHAQRRLRKPRGQERGMQRCRAL